MRGVGPLQSRSLRGRGDRPMLLPTRRVRRRVRYARPPRGVSIPLQNAYPVRPVEVANRGNLGYWERDLIMFKRESGQHNVITLSA